MIALLKRTASQQTLLQVCVSYIGALLTAPRAARQAELQEIFKFKCGCERCRAEERAANHPATAFADVSAALSAAVGDSLAGAGPATISALQDHIYERCQELGDALDKAISKGNEDDVATVRTQLTELRDRLERSMRMGKVSSKARKWLQASVYELYDLLSLCADEAAGDNVDGETESLAACVRALGAVAAGSDAHVELSLEHMSRTQRKFGEEHEEAMQAAAACRAAHVARYGRVSDKLLSELFEARANA